ncbi:MAG: 4Fe-4S dicluster domain-containing protein [bacterium]
MKKALYIDVSKCLGCRSCVFACAVEHSSSKNRIGALSEIPRPRSRVHIAFVEKMAIPLQCRHCEDAPCVAICPTRAIKKLGPQEPVIIDNKMCIGCKFCIVSCPFGVISLTDDGKAAIKCDRCISRQKEGRLPACVEACPTHAIKFLSIDEINAEKRRQAAQKEVAAITCVEVS